MNKTKRRYLLLIAFILIFLQGCSQLRKLERSLPPADRDFLSIIRYVITPEEKKAFLSLPAGEREQFKKDFWKKRDPDPETEENLYKKTYFSRIEKANQLFTSEGRNGWLSHRGRVYILLGRPDERRVYPTGYSFYEPPVEIWYYGMFPIIFVDRYRLGKYDILPLSEYHIAQLTKARMLLHPEVKKMKTPFDFDIKVKKLKKGEIEVQIAIPYKMISFLEKGKKFKAILDISTVIFDLSGKTVKKLKKSEQIFLVKEDLEKLERAHLIKETINLLSGKYSIKVLVKNRYDDKKAEKKLRINVE